MINLKVARNTVRDQAVENIKEAILTGFLKPGQRLIERDLCELCGISRTSVREALRILEGEKLIVNLPHKGPRVATPTLEEAEQIYETRALLEAMLGRYAASSATDSDVKALHRAVDEFEDQASKENLPGMVTSTEAFYALLGQVANRPIAVDLLQTLKARISTLRATSMSSKGRSAYSAQELRAIVRAVAKKDSEAAANACIVHVQRAAKAAKIRLTEVGEPMPAARPAAAATPKRRAKLSA